jgi:hypothetical protein
MHPSCLSHSSAPLTISIKRSNLAICDYNNCKSNAQRIGQTVLETHKVKQIDFMKQLVEKYEGQPGVNLADVLKLPMLDEMIFVSKLTANLET